MINAMTKEFNIDFYVYDFKGKEQSKLLYSMRNYTEEEMEMLGLVGGFTHDAQDAMLWTMEINEAVNEVLKLINKDTIEAAKILHRELINWGNKGVKGRLFVRCMNGNVIDISKCLNRIHRDEKTSADLLTRILIYWLFIPVNISFVKEMDALIKHNRINCLDGDSQKQLETLIKIVRLEMFDALEYY